MAFKEYYQQISEEEKLPTKGSYRELVKELTALINKAKKEEGGIENQNIIFKEVMLIGIRKDPKNFLEKAEEIIAKYPQFDITKNNVHWTDCLIIDGVSVAPPVEKEKES